MQSRLMSFVEAIMNVLVGAAINALANAVVLPLFGFYPTWGQIAGMTAIFTFISIARSYVLRRAFNAVSRR
jgi:chemotaxis protein CheY-P-specific phosphatase CheC